MADQGGATAIEYAMIAGLVSIVMVTALIAVGDQLVVWAEAVLAGLGG